MVISEKEGMMGDREPVVTVEELETLDSDEMVEGYRDGYKGETRAGDNRSKAYWHGWRNGMVDGGHAESDPAMGILARAILAASPNPPL